MDSLVEQFDVYCRAAILIATYELTKTPKDEQWFDIKLENEIQQGLITRDKAEAIKIEIKKQLTNSDRDATGEESDVTP